MDDALKAFGNQSLAACRLFPGMWQPGVVHPPTMIFGEESALGVSGTEQGKPKVSFAFHAKPYCGDNWFHTQHLVASVAIRWRELGAQWARFNVQVLVVLKARTRVIWVLAPDKLERRIPCERCSRTIGFQETPSTWYFEDPRAAETTDSRDQLTSNEATAAQGGG